MGMQGNHVLRDGTLLGGRYRIVKCLGEGGFGITYLGTDIKLDLQVAIKEYYPTGHVTRECNTTNKVTVFTGPSQEFFAKDRSKFLSEAKILAKFANLPGIVSVSDFFDDNNTSYIVMEYLDGITLEQYVVSRGGRISAAECLEKVRPVIESMREIHATGLIHRDISPDNIMLTSHGQTKLIDFGTAREVVRGQDRSLSIMLKPGYAPEEQYRSHGNQGPWTDVYAMCGTIYRCITGCVPVESLERLAGGGIKSPSSLGVSMPDYQENAIMRGLAVNANYRTRSMDELYTMLYMGGRTGETVVLFPKEDNKANEYHDNNMAFKGQTAILGENDRNPNVNASLSGQQENKNRVNNNQANNNQFNNNQANRTPQNNSKKTTTIKKRRKKWWIPVVSVVGFLFIVGMVVSLSEEVVKKTSEIMQQQQDAQAQNTQVQIQNSTNRISESIYNDTLPRFKTTVFSVMVEIKAADSSKKDYCKADVVLYYERTGLRKYEVSNAEITSYDSMAKEIIYEVMSNYSQEDYENNKSDILQEIKDSLYDVYGEEIVHHVEILQPNFS